MAPRNQHYYSVNWALNLRDLTATQIHNRLKKGKLIYDWINFQTTFPHLKKWSGLHLPNLVCKLKELFSVKMLTQDLGSLYRCGDVHDGWWHLMSSYLFLTSDVKAGAVAGSLGPIIKSTGTQVVSFQNIMEAMK